MACDFVSYKTLEHRACNGDLGKSVCHPFAASKGSHGGLIFEEDCEVETTVARPLLIQERECCHHGPKRKLFPRNYNPLNIVRLKLECFLL